MFIIRLWWLWLSIFCLWYLPISFLRAAGFSFWKAFWIATGLEVAFICFILRISSGKAAPEMYGYGGENGRAMILKENPGRIEASSIPDDAHKQQEIGNRLTNDYLHRFNTDKAIEELDTYENIVVPRFPQEYKEAKKLWLEGKNLQKFENFQIEAHPRKPLPEWIEMWSKAEIKGRCEICKTEMRDRKK